MIFNIMFSVENFENKIQISVSRATKPGQRIVKESVTERAKDINGNFLYTPHSTYPNILLSGVNYFLIEGSVRLRHEWQDGDNFSDADVDDYKSLLETTRRISQLNRC